MKTKLTLTVLTVCITMLAKAQLPVPADKAQIPILITGATIHIGNGEVIENGVIVIENDIIKEVGKSEEVLVDKSRKEVINAKGKHIYPGFINVNNTLGLREIDAVRATEDYRESGSMNPHVRALIAFNTESRVAWTVRTNGVLLTQATPRGGLISGQSAIMHLDGWNWEDAAVLESDGIHLNWPSNFSYKWEPGEGLKKEKNKDKDKIVENLDQFFTKAIAYGKLHKELDMRMEAMQPVMAGKSNLYLHAQEAKDIINGVNFAKKYNVKTVIVGGQEAYLVADFLKENNVPVILNRVHSLPGYEDEPVLTPYEVAAKLDKAGIVYCLGWAGDMEAMNSRNLSFGAGSTVAHGVAYEKAVQSISLNTAKIVGIDNHYGSLEKGKSATLFISEGDALDIRTNDITFIWINGRKIDLNNHQKELNKKYTEKYGID